MVYVTRITVDPGEDWTELKKALTPDNHQYEGDALVAGTTCDGVTVNYTTVQIPRLEGLPDMKIVVVPSCLDTERFGAPQAGGPYTFYRADLDPNVDPEEFAVNIVTECVLSKAFP